MNADTVRRLRRRIRIGSRVQYAKPRDAVATYPQSRVQRYVQLGKLVPSAFNRRG